MSRPSVSATELEILKVLWDDGPRTVREVNTVLEEQGRDLAYTTVSTLLDRLREKGFVKVDKRRSTHRFHPLVTRQELVGQRLHEIAENLCDGTTTPLVRALVDAHSFTASEIAEFRELLDRLETQGPKKKRTRRR